MAAWQEIDRIQGTYALAGMYKRLVWITSGILIVSSGALVVFTSAHYPLNFRIGAGAIILAFMGIMLYALYQAQFRPYLDVTIDRLGFTYRRKTSAQRYAWTDIKSAHYGGNTAFICVQKSVDQQPLELPLPRHPVSEEIMKACRKRGMPIGVVVMD